MEGHILVGLQITNNQYLKPYPLIISKINDYNWVGELEI